ncbi:hypothetical protein NKR23_g4712 [Pleurostoma richardsiae]|uniref:Zn(2)-C6 fungal-type domain-containing protein n=1 Tax=Pleurostoma richardsiae TaxID=41990 RepID=A0AA38RVW8_9PEZI|nr:hypothetical protein NKR23_g4712 [Pleurostoma richardsiae]
MRKVKCDEAKPHCQRCKSYGVVCNYGANVAELQVPVEGSSGWKETGRPEGSLVDSNSTDVLRYSNPVIMDASDIRECQMVSLYTTEVLKLAFSHPFLMHAALAMAATHDRYLGTTQPRRRTLREQYHSTQCITLFNQKLSEPVRLQDRDPLWATAAMLAILAVSSVEAESIEDSWPLASVSPLTYSSCMHPTELDWINISEGKRTIWNLVDPLRPDSIFYGLFQ